MRSGNAYEFDNIDSRADISRASARLSCALILRHKRAPWGITPAEYEKVMEWADAVIGGVDSMPPMQITRFFPVRWPGEPALTNGQRAEMNMRPRGS